MASPRSHARSLSEDMLRCGCRLLMYNYSLATSSIYCLSSVTLRYPVMAKCGMCSGEFPFALACFTCSPP